MRDMAHAATEFLVDFIERLPNAPASDLDGALEAARRMREEPPEARGILTSGGSMANFSAIVTARRTRLAEDFLRGTLYVSAQTHASVAKSAVLAGFPAANVRKVPCASGLEIDLEALTQLIK